MMHSELQMDGTLDPDRHTLHTQAEVKPTGVHAGKTKHKNAVQYLLQDLSDAIADKEENSQMVA